MRGPSQRRRTRRGPPLRRAWQAVRRDGGVPPRFPRGRAVARGHSRGIDLVVSDEHAPPAERGRGMHERLRARARRVEREPKTPQPARCRPSRRVSAISHGKVLGQPCEEHVPALIAGWPRRICEQLLTRLHRLCVILLQELDHQPPPRVEARFGCDEAAKLIKAHRLVTHKHRVANAAPLASPQMRAWTFTARLLPTSRLEAFSDGVFAIAITLLVLELHVPTGQEALVKGLEHEWPRYLGYFVSFAFIGGVWIAHSNMTRFLKAADPDLMRLNLMLLLFVSFLPFTTAIAATHVFASNLSFHGLTESTTAERVAVVLFGLNLTLAALML